MELIGASKSVHGVIKQNHAKVNQRTHWQRAGTFDSASIDKKSLIYSKIEELRAASSPSSPICFRCTDIGHFSYQCQSPISCFACNRLGHKAFQCRAITEMPHTFKATSLETPLMVPKSHIITDPINGKPTVLNSTSSHQDEMLRMSFLLDDAEQWGLLKIQRALCQLIPQHDWVVKISKTDIHIEMKVGENYVRQTHFPKPLQEVTKNRDESMSTCIFGNLSDKTLNETHISSKVGDVLRTNEIDFQEEMRDPGVFTYEIERLSEIELDKEAINKSEEHTNQNLNAIEITSVEPVFIERDISDTKTEKCKSIVEETTIAQSLGQQKRLKSATHQLRLSGGSKKARRSLAPQIAFLNRLKKSRDKGRIRGKHKEVWHVCVIP